MKKKLFLCHASEDKSFVRRLTADLNAEDLPCWVDEWEILVGDRIRERIETGLSDAAYLGLVLSPDSVRSKWVEMELDAALLHEVESRNVVVLPLLFRDCEVPLLLRAKHHADFRKDYDSGLQSLLARLRSGNKEEDLKSQVLARLGKLNPLRIDIHALTLLAIQSRELEAAEDLIAAHETVAPHCHTALQAKGMIAFTRWVQTRSVGDFLITLQLAHRLVRQVPNQGSINNLASLAAHVPQDSRCLDPVLRLLRECVGEVRTRRSQWAMTCTAIYIQLLHRLPLDSENIREACAICCELANVDDEAFLRGSLGKLAHACTHLAAAMKDPESRSAVLRDFFQTAMRRLGESREFSEAFLHLAWAAIQLGNIKQAQALLAKYKLTVSTEAFDKAVKSHPMLEGVQSPLVVAVRAIQAKGASSTSVVEGRLPAAQDS